jgi:hypothetical protein
MDLPRQREDYAWVPTFGRAKEILYDAEPDFQHAD